MKALITGITGFIGSHVAELLLEKDDQIVGVARGGWHPDAPQSLVDSVPLFSWDIRKPAPGKLLSELSQFAPAVVLHFAGISIPRQCGRETPTRQAIAVNVDGTSNVLDLAQKIPARPRVVFASTCHVYDRVDKTDPIVHEASPLNPISAYGKTKLRCEQEIQRRVAISRLNACIVRGFHHIGPRQPSGLMLTDWLEQFGPDCAEISVRSTNSFLDLVDVRDAARAYYLLASKSIAVDICNLGSGKISRSRDVLNALLAKQDGPIEVIVQSDDEKWNAIADTSILNLLGWKTQIDYEQTISDMISCKMVSQT